CFCPLPAIEVTATRIPENVDQVPAHLSIIQGDELRARGVTDLRTALSLVAGVEAPPGGDTGPAGAVPSFWGLHELYAFLLVVDGVPWGGAIRPQQGAGGRRHEFLLGCRQLGKCGRG